MKLIAVYQNPLGATSFYRGAGVLNQLAKEHGFSISSPESLSWSDLIDTDILFFERPHHPNQMGLMQHAQKMGVKIWVDWDDDPFHIPLSNPAFQAFAPKAVRSDIIDMIQLADMVTVSTPALWEIFATVRDKKPIRVVPNAWDMRRYPHPERRAQKQTVLWRGSDTHSQDLDEVGSEYREAIEKHPKVTFAFMGYFPYRIVSQNRVTPLPNVRFQPTSDIIRYVNRIREAAPSIVVVPLHDDTFNRCKSNIAWLEATAAGAVVIAPKLPEWERPGIVNYEPGEFGEKLTAMIAADEDVLAGLWRESANWIAVNETMELANHKRMEIIRAMVEMTGGEK